MEASEPEIRLNLPELDRLLEELGYTSDAKKAECLGIGGATLSRLRKNQQRCGNKVISRVRAAFPKVPYERLFLDRTS